MLKNDLQVLSLIYHKLTTLAFSRTSRTKFAKSSPVILTSIMITSLFYLFRYQMFISVSLLRVKEKIARVL